MRPRIAILSPALCVAVWAGAAMAEPPAYFGLKGGVVMPDVAGLGSAINGGLTMGYAWGRVAMEAELTATLLDGDTEMAATSWTITTLGLYVAIRGPQSVYWKVRAGVMDERVRFNTVGVVLTGDNSPWSVGAGVGFSLPEARRMELELTWLDQDILLWSAAYLF